MTTKSLKKYMVYCEKNELVPTLEGAKNWSIYCDRRAKQNGRVRP